jgi:hypothetical protein
MPKSNMQLALVNEESNIIIFKKLKKLTIPILRMYARKVFGSGCNKYKKIQLVNELLPYWKEIEPDYQNDIKLLYEARKDFTEKRVNNQETTLKLRDWCLSLTHGTIGLLEHRPHGIHNQNNDILIKIIEIVQREDNAIPNRMIVEIVNLPAHLPEAEEYENNFVSSLKEGVHIYLLYFNSLGGNIIPGFYIYSYRLFTPLDIVFYGNHNK